MILPPFIYFTAVDTELWVVTDTPENCVAIQRGLDGLEKLAERNHMKFSSTEGEAKSCPCRAATPGTRIRWQGAGWEAPWQRTALESWWATSGPQASNSKGGKRLPELHQEEHCQQVERSDPSVLLRTGETLSKCWVQFWNPQYKKDTCLCLLEWV